MEQSLISRLLKPRLFQRAWKKLFSFFYNEQWIVLLSTSANSDKPNWRDFKPLLPPPDRDWADPFIWKHGDRHYIFIEEKLFSEPYGHISCLVVDERMNILSNTMILSRPYHLSYPYLFEFGGQLYMIPETMENNAVELYRCTQFPNEWKFEKTLIPNVRAVDSTLIEHQGRWWLFANVESEGSTWDTLNLYHADNPISDQWKPHPLNPIVRDINSARPAGNIFWRGEDLIRPSQDCSVRYGYATNFNRIIKLTTSDFSEMHEHVFNPPSIGKTLGTHTWNEAEGMTAIDAIIYRRKP
jgi:hypothetical protein